jgi:hypothetical protein
VLVERLVLPVLKVLFARPALLLQGALSFMLALSLQKVLHVRRALLA